MKHILRRVVSAIVFWLALAVMAVATQTAVTISNGSGSGTSYSYQMTVGPQGNVSNTTLCDGGGGSPCASVTANGVATVPHADIVGGATLAHIISVTSTNATSIKASAGTLYQLSAISVITTTVPYLKLYDTSTAPNCGTQPVLATYPVLAAGGFTITFPVGAAFVNGIGMCLTANQTDTDNTAVVPGFTIDMLYK